MNISLKDGRNIRKFKRYDLIFKIAIFSYEDCFLLIVFINLHLIINIY